MKRKYLDDIGHVLRHDNTWGKKHDKRNLRFFNQRRIYGFDERETWNLDIAFMEWLYERISMFLDLTIADLTFHKYEIADGVECSQQDILHTILYDLEYILDDNNDEDSVKIEKQKEVLKLWSLVYFDMWW